MSRPMKHGTAFTYGKRGCRCDACKDFQRERNATNRADRLASGRLTHGKRSAYDAGCRCALCKEARRVASASVDLRSAARRQAADRG